MAIGLGILELGLVFSLMSLGIFITFRLLKFPDLTIDGSFVLGMAISVVYAYDGQPFLGLVISVFAGLLAGAVTGLLMTKLMLSPILSGIITMTALYSINLRIMGGRPNISLFGKETIFSLAKNSSFAEYSSIILLSVFCAVLIILMALFLKTGIGLSLIATGDNEAMVKASSINSDAIKILGIALGNSIVAFAGGVYAQYQNFADISGGVGMMVIGVASIIVGKEIIGGRSLLLDLISVVLGSILYRLVLTSAMLMGLNPSDLKLISAALVAILISLPVLKKYRAGKKNRKARMKGAKIAKDR